MIKTHEIEISQVPFMGIQSGNKVYDFLPTENNYEAGDFILYKMVNEEKELTNQAILVQVTSVEANANLKEGISFVAIKKISY